MHQSDRLRYPVPPLSCDTLVALPSATADGTALFGKNSDRQPEECQRLVLLPRGAHAQGSRVRCQYIDVPQVRETARVLGSQPYWLWGLEHGVNEHGVAIGNEMVATREPVAPIGLLGMDLVRLGLERARTAAEAVEVMTDLLDAHGQGGSGQPHVDWAYHNSFLVADPRTAWILEASGRHWAARSVREAAHITNHIGIADDWERLAPDTASFAVVQGWWREEHARLDFAGAYRDAESLPRNVSEGRARRAGALLQQARGRISTGTLRGILRDHYRAGVHYRGGCQPEDEEYFSVCMHAGSLMGTTASMIAQLPDGGEPPVAWVALGAPCVSVYLPYYLDGPIPAAVASGGGEPSPAAAWWRFHALRAHVEADPERLAPLVRTYWDGLEGEVADRARHVEARAADLRARGDAEGVARLLGEFMATNVNAMLRGLQELDDVSRRGRPSPTAA